MIWCNQCIGRMDPARVHHIVLAGGLSYSLGVDLVLILVCINIEVLVCPVQRNAAVLIGLLHALR